MGDRGNCKLFAPNYFNATKCQNCFKPKEQHTVQETPAGGKPSAASKAVHGGRNAVVTKTLLKESVLLKSLLGRDQIMPETWQRHWFALYSNGELQEYKIVDGQINKEMMTNSVMLQEFIRMLDGKAELGEDLCFGMKTLRETIYFKTTTKVDYENWWKEISSFVASPLKRTSSVTPKSNLIELTRSSLCKQLSVPISTISPTRSSRSSSVSSLQSDPGHPQIDILRSQISKLEEENEKLSKAEDQRRKLELEVNYWKEYVTNAQLIKRGGGSTDNFTELADARRQLIQLQDELNQSQKKLKSNTGKLLMRNKEVTDSKEKLRESNSIIAVYKAKIDQLSKELSTKNYSKDISEVVTKERKDSNSTDKKTMQVDYVGPSQFINTDARHLEDKFLLLKEKLKRIERELLIKSKELEKANESRSKVAKYTRSLLQELETRLSDNQQKLGFTEDKLKNVNIELVMERERRIKLEEGPRRRTSTISSPGKLPTHAEIMHSSGSTNSIYSPASNLTEHDADTKYADYYRSRFKEAESSLLTKDKKLHQAEERIKEIQTSMKHNSDNYKVINELQSKLSDATHKLSDRQLKIHELTCEVGRLKQFEKTSGKQRQQCGTLEDIIKDLENKNSELTKSMHQVRQELEMLKIREVFLKEQLQEAFADDSEDSEESEDSDNDSKLGKSVDLKKKIEAMVDLESQCKHLTLTNETLTKKCTELDTRLRQINMSNFESNKDIISEENIGNNLDQNGKKIKELEESLLTEEDGFFKQLTIIKEKHSKELSTLENNYQTDIASRNAELEKCRIEIDRLLGIKSELEIKIEQFSEKLSTFEREEKSPQTDIRIGSKDQQEIIPEERSSVLLSEVESDVFIDELSEDCKFADSGKTLRKQTEVDCSTEKDYVDSSYKDRDSGIVITQEIKSMIDASKSNNTEIIIDDNFYWETSNSSTTSRDSVSEMDTIEKCKTVCSRFQIKITELSAQYVTSEEKAIELAQILEQKAMSEKAFLLEYDILLGRIDELESQIIDSQELLQSKADELEKERKNVINLVEVTSAYIKELEESLEESKTKFNNLKANQKDGVTADETTLIEDSRLNETQRCESTDNEEDKVVHQKLTAKIMTLQSDISELKENHVREIKAMQSKCQEEMEDARKCFSEGVLMSRVESLEIELQEQNQSYLNEVELLNKHFQTELKKAFSGNNAGIDMLNRMQELEMEVEETRKACEFKMKEMKNDHEVEKDHMASALQEATSSKFSDDFIDAYEPSNATVEELEDRIIKLEQDLIDMEQKCNDDLEMEKVAHQTEMEDTIRDMMMVRHATTRYSDDVDDKDVVHACNHTESSTQPSSGISQEEVDDMKANHQEELQNLSNEHEEELSQIRSDFSIVISSLRQGNSSDTIMELQTKVKEYEQEALDTKKKKKKDMSDLENKLKRSESSNFFATRRNEEMGGKIYHMQIELEEMDRNHQLEIATYQEKLGFSDGSKDNDVNECIKQNEEYKQKNKLLEKELEDLRKEHEQNIESSVMKLHEGKQEEIREMTDKVLKLESLIDEMDVKEGEEDNASSLKQTIKEQKEDYENQITSMKSRFTSEKEEMEIQHEKNIDDIRLQYDEKLKSNYKDALHHQDLTEYKTDSQKLKRLSSENDDLSTKLLEQEAKYKIDMKQKNDEIRELQKTLENVKIKSSNNKIDMNKDITNLTEGEKENEDMQKKVKEIQEQMERYDRRIEYYLEKSAREGTEESPRVTELRLEIVKLQKEMSKMKNNKRKSDHEKEKQEKATSSTKGSSRGNADAMLRRHTDNVTVKARKRERDPRKRWSNLEESSEKEESKSGTVLARRTLWESKSTDEGKLVGQ